MSYCTYYTLSVIPPSKETEETEIAGMIGELRAKYTGAEYALNADGSINNMSKWYDHASDMKEFSAIYPSFRFMLSGEGEEPGDVWDKYFVNGKMQECRAELIPPPAFDPTQLS